MAKWNIDSDHSVCTFSIRHLMVAFVHGQFNKVSGVIEFDPDDIGSMAVELAIETDSLITGIAKRDDHLKSEEFFDAKRYPEIAFQSTKSVQTAYNSSKVSGDLYIHGIKKFVTVEINILGPVKSPFGETTIGLTGMTVLNREDFGMNWNQPMEKGGFMVGSDAELTISIEGDLVEE